MAWLGQSFGKMIGIFEIEFMMSLPRTLFKDAKGPVVSEARPGGSGGRQHLLPPDLCQVLSLRLGYVCGPQPLLPPPFGPALVPQKSMGEWKCSLYALLFWACDLTASLPLWSFGFPVWLMGMTRKSRPQGTKAEHC